jgi:NDP-sugar pyrophosphorylase family protein
MKALILAAGLGTRLKPLTNSIPKALIPIKGKTLLEYQILKLKKYDFNEIIINIHHFPDQIIDFLKSKNNFGLNIKISDERDFLLDTGGGIHQTEWFFNDGKPFLVHNVDIFSNIDLYQLYRQHLSLNGLATLVVSSRKTSRYLLFDESLQLKGWFNGKTQEIKPMTININQFQKLAFAGIQILSPQVFKLMNNWEPPFSIIDFYLQNMERYPIFGYIPPGFKILDVGKIQALNEAEKIIPQFFDF